MKIRCECRKRIQVDDAFAGGMCRCPYCKAIVYVPEMAGVGKGAGRPIMPGGRPSTPGAASRPMAPGGRPAAPGATPATRPVSRPATPPAPPHHAGTSPTAAPPRPVHQEPAPSEEQIPMARPVLFQGIVTLVLLGILLVMVAGTGAMAIKIFYLDKNKSTQPPPPPPPVNPFENKVGGPVVAGNISITPPVVYLIDVGSSMSSSYDIAVLLARVSVKSLKEDQRFGLILCGEGKDMILPGGLNAGGPKGSDTITEFVKRASGLGMGASNLTRAFNLAIGLQPQTLVIFCHKPLDDALAAKAKSAGVKVVLLTIDGDELEPDFKKFASQAGGEYRLLSSSQLQSTLPTD